MTERTAKLIGILGSTLFLSFAILFLLFGKEHWHLIVVSIPCILVALKYSVRAGSRIFFLMDSQVNLQLPSTCICEPSRKNACLVFLLKKSQFVIWNDGQQKLVQWNRPFEPVPPVMLESGFVVWSKAHIDWFDYDGKHLGEFALPKQGVSLLKCIEESVLIGTTENALYRWHNPEMSPVLLNIEGIPLSIDADNGCLMTSNGCFYDLSDLSQAVLLHKIDREILGGFRIAEHLIYFDDKGQIFGSRCGGEESFLDNYRRDFFYPCKVGQKVIFVNRNQQCCSLELNEDKYVSQVILQIENNPSWLRWFGSFLLIYADHKSGGKLFKIGPCGDYQSVPVSGTFNPLGIDESAEVFHYAAADQWFQWNLNEKEPLKLEQDCPEQILFFEQFAYKRVHSTWYSMQNETINELTVDSHDGNYICQRAGVISYWTG